MAHSLYHHTLANYLHNYNGSFLTIKKIRRIQHLLCHILTRGDIVQILLAFVFFLFTSLQSSGSDPHRKNNCNFRTQPNILI